MFSRDLSTVKMPQADLLCLLKLEFCLQVDRRSQAFTPEIAH